MTEGRLSSSVTRVALTNWSVRGPEEPAATWRTKTLLRKKKKKNLVFPAKIKKKAPAWCHESFLINSWPDKTPWKSVQLFLLCCFNNLIMRLSLNKPHNKLPRVEIEKKEKHTRTHAGAELWARRRWRMIYWWKKEKRKGWSENIGSDKRGQGASDSRVKTEVMFNSR